MTNQNMNNHECKIENGKKKNLTFETYSMSLEARVRVKRRPAKRTTAHRYQQWKLKAKAEYKRDNGIIFIVDVELKLLITDHIRGYLISIYIHTLIVTFL